MNKREFVMLLHEYADQDVSGWMWSEKFNGMCAFWDGGMTTGMPCSEIPFANTLKHGRYKVPPVATGLWSRYGQPIQCPPLWRRLLPKFPLHGELAVPGLTIQGVSKIVKTIDPNPMEWMWVQFKVFEAPHIADFAREGRIYNNIWEKIFDREICAWILDRFREKGLKSFANEPLQFGETYSRFQTADFWNNNVVMVEQNKLPNHMLQACEIVCTKMWETVDAGGEGIVIRDPHSYWEAKRIHGALKFKPNEEAEATVIGLTYGKKTDKGSKLLGKMGALLVEWNGKQFKLSGFTEDERELTSDVVDPTIEAMACPGEEASSGVEAARFRRGSKIKFKYRELTDDGVPAEARYAR
jgi:hypothetical protein